MADRYDNRFRDRWAERERDPEFEERRNRSGYGYSSSYYPDREGWEDRSDYESRRSSESDYDRDEATRRGGGYRGERGFREAPEGYTGRNEYTGHSGYRSHVEGRSQAGSGYGQTPFGTNWGTGGSGRHRLGSLTESAAYGARSILGGREGRYAEENYGHAGRGPKGYRRSDERITEEVNERLTRDPEVDATDIEVRVDSGTVTLSGTVEDRQSKRVAEDIANDVWGVTDVQNQIRVHRYEAGSTSGAGASPSTSATGQTGTAQTAGHSATAVTRH